MEMELVKGLVFTCLFLIGLCAVEHHFRFSRLPYICWMVLFGAHHHRESYCMNNRSAVKRNSKESISVQSAVSGGAST